MDDIQLRSPSASEAPALSGDPSTALSWGKAVALHLAPGAALLLFWIAAVPWLEAAGWPPVWGLLLGTLVVLVPIELGLLWHSARRRGETGVRAALGWSPLRRADAGPVVLTGVMCLIGPGLVIWLEPVLRASLFAWLPDWFTPSLFGLARYSPGVVAATVALWLISMVIVGPAVEELYFRGWLLPRLPGRPATRCTAHVALFAVYHLWQPHAAITIFAFALPLALLVQARRNPLLSVVVHCSVNLLLLVGMLAGALQR